MRRPLRPVAEVRLPPPPAELRDRLAAVEARMRPMGGLPFRRGDRWAMHEGVPADMLREWLTLVGETGVASAARGREG